VNSIETFCFSYCAFSLQNYFKIFIIFDNCYHQLFPTKPKDDNLFISLNYNEIKNIIDKSISDFFTLYQKFDNCNKTNHSIQFISTSPFNQIFKKILLENNSRRQFINNISDKKSLVLIISDCKIHNTFSYDQKLLYLLKKNNIIVDCIHLGEHNAEYNSKFESIAYYCDGLFENIIPNDKDSNLTQILLMKFMPLPQGGKKKHANISEGAIQEEKIRCDECGKVEDNQIYNPQSGMIICGECNKKNNISMNTNVNNNNNSTVINIQ
jgi:hypothetical protein